MRLDNLSLLNLIVTKCWPMVGGAGLLRRGQKGCWGRKRLWNAAV